MYRLVAFLIIFLAAASLFGALAEEVDEGDTAMFDQTTLHSINNIATPALDQLFLIVTQFGGVAFVSVVSILLLCYFLYKRRHHEALLVSAGVGGAVLINYTAKLTFVRERPDLWEQLITETTYSFPSGHAAGSAALALCVVAILWQTRWRVSALMLAPVYILLVGFSRMYLGVHYLTDIIAGWTLSIAWVSLVITLIYAHRSRAVIRSTAQDTSGEHLV